MPNNQVMDVDSFMQQRSAPAAGPLDVDSFMAKRTSAPVTTAAPSMAPGTFQTRPGGPLRNASQLPTRSVSEMLGEGEETVAAGNAEVGKQYMQAGPQAIVGGVQDIAQGQIAHGAHRIVSGATVTALPAIANVLPIELAAAPVMTAAGIAGGAGLQYGAEKGATALGATPDQAALAGDAGALIGGTLAGGLAKAKFPDFVDSLQEAPDVAAQRAARPPIKGAEKFQRDLAGARPYLKGAKDLKDLQARIPVAKNTVWQPYSDALDQVGDRPVNGPDGPTTVRGLETQRLETSAQLRATKKLPALDQQTALQKGQNIADLQAKYNQITGTLDPHLQEAGIDPVKIREVHGNLTGVQRLVNGRNTLTEATKPYGFGKMANIDISHPLSELGNIKEGFQDLIAGRPLWSGKPTDLAVKEGFRVGGTLPEFSRPSQPDLPFQGGPLFDQSAPTMPVGQPNIPPDALAKIPGNSPITHLDPSQYGSTTPYNGINDPARLLAASNVDNMAPYSRMTGEYHPDRVNDLIVGPSDQVDPAIAPPPQSGANQLPGPSTTPSSGQSPQSAIEAAGGQFIGSKDYGVNNGLSHLFNDPQTGSTLMMNGDLTTDQVAQHIQNSRAKFTPPPTASSAVVANPETTTSIRALRSIKGDIGGTAQGSWNGLAIENASNDLGAGSRRLLDELTGHVPSHTVDDLLVRKHPSIPEGQWPQYLQNLQTERAKLKSQLFKDVDVAQQGNLSGDEILSDIIKPALRKYDLVEAQISGRTEPDAIGGSYPAAKAGRRPRVQSPDAEPPVQVAPKPVANNASGQGGSLEEINRTQANKANGVSYTKRDRRTGNEVPVISSDPESIHLGPHEELVHYSRSGAYVVSKGQDIPRGVPKRAYK